MEENTTASRQECAFFSIIVSSWEASKENIFIFPIWMAPCDVLEILPVWRNGDAGNSHFRLDIEWSGWVCSEPPRCLNWI